MVTKLSHEQLSALRRIDSPTISNAIETFKLRPHVAGYVGYDIRCIFPELPPTVGSECRHGPPSLLPCR